MSIATLRSLGQLKQQADSLGLVVKPTKRTSAGPNTYSKDDFVYALRDYFLSQREHVSSGLKKMLTMESPMLCRQLKDTTAQEQKEIWDSPRWIFEEKIDGNRMVITYSDEDGLEFFSRNNSVEDFLPVSYTENILMEKINLEPLKGMNFMIDSEVVSTNPNISTVMGNRGVICATQLQATTAILACHKEQSWEIQRVDPLEFKVFDCMITKDGQDIRDKDLLTRKKALKPIYDALKLTGLVISHPKLAKENRRQFYKEIVEAGGEGCVAKNIHGKYNATSSRARDGWVKIKRTATESLSMSGLGDTLDAFVSGFTEADDERGWSGLIGGLKFSIYLRHEDGSVDEQPKEIARITNVPQVMRQEMTEIGEDGKPRLKSEYYGRVASLDGQDVSARSYRLSHARLVVWRPDRSMDTCIVDESWLKANVL